MKAPEKIYMPKELLSEEWTRHIEGQDFEYTRTDAFIEKACKWFERQYEWHDKLGVRHCDMKEFYDFINYMKGE